MLVLMKVLPPGRVDELHGAGGVGYGRRQGLALASFPECPCCLRACVALGLIQRRSTPFARAFSGVADWIFFSVCASPAFRASSRIGELCPSR